VPAIAFPDVVDAADVRVRDIAGEPDFGDEARDEVRMRSAAGRQQLQRDALAELEVVSAVDLAGRATPEQTDDPVARREDPARRKSRVPERLGVGDAQATLALEPRDRRIAVAVCARFGVRTRIVRRQLLGRGDRVNLRAAGPACQDRAAETGSDGT